MKLREPQLSPPKVEPIRDANIITETRKYRLITPLFGGGVKAQEADPITVIRGPSVRGQLRFWWRATRGGQFNGNLDAMRKAEQAIWGSATKKDDKNTGPSKVQVVVTEVTRGQSQKSVPVKNRKTGKFEQIHVGEPKSPLSYVAFPLRKEDNKPAGELLEGVTFSLHIEYPSSQTPKGLTEIEEKTLTIQDEVQATLWAWETFGGIGARTRRGFGALQLLSVNGKSVQPPTDIDRYLQDNLPKFIRNGMHPKGVPHLSLSIIALPKSKSTDATETWKFLFQKMRDFRQARYPDKHNYAYGRSKWPEPDSIRRFTKKHSPGHEPQHRVTDKYPRAQFGLPIIIQFKKDDVKAGDPSQHTLRPSDSERWASPLILRPIACDDGFIGLAVRLSPSLNELNREIILEDNPVQWNISKSDANQIEPLNGETDVIEAFLKTLK